MQKDTCAHHSPASLLPPFPPTKTQGASKMRVVVTLGHTTLEFRARSNRKGIVEWNQGDEVREDVFL